jgi:hypothetical protein
MMVTGVGEGYDEKKKKGKRKKEKEKSLRFQGFRVLTQRATEFKRRERQRGDWASSLLERVPMLRSYAFEG